MKPEYHVCQVCPIQTTCHEELVPETVARDKWRRRVPARFLPTTEFGCRHYTCGTDGTIEAVRAKESSDKLPFYVEEQDGSRHVVLASVFGSQFKPTERGALRIISDDGNVYSRQDGLIYYSTGQNK